MTLALREKHDGALSDRSSIRLWLRLLTCTTVMEKRVKRRLAERGATLPRFDVLAALDRHPDGMALGALSSALLVSQGNVTALVQTLLKDGLVEMSRSQEDRRSSIVRLTAAGRATFADLADAHHGWIEDMLANLSRADRQALYTLLGALKRSIGQEVG